MGDLAAFRDHARAMSTAQHQTERCEKDYKEAVSRLTFARRFGPGWGEPDEPPTRCPGCVTDADRALWARLADQLAAYLTTDEEAGLFA